MLRKFNLILLTALLVSSHTAFGQVYTGSVMVGGSIGGAYSSGEITSPGFSEKYSYTQAMVNTKAGYFFRQPIAVGLMGEFLYDSHDFKSEEFFQDSSVYFLLAGPFVRYYFANHIFIEGSFGYGTSTIHKKDKFSIMRGAAGIGYAAFINDKVAFEPMLSYIYNVRKGDGEIEDKRGGIAISMGLQVYLYRNPKTIFRQSL